MMVGDSPVDRQTARNAGTAICLVALRLRLLVRPGDLDGTETIIETPLEIVGQVVERDCVIVSFQRLRERSLQLTAESQ